MGHTISLATTHFCCCGAKTATRYTDGRECIQYNLICKKRWEAGFGQLPVVCQSLVYRIKFIFLNLASNSLSSVPNISPQSYLVLFPMNILQLFILELNLEQFFKLDTTDNWVWIMLSYVLWDIRNIPGYYSIDINNIHLVVKIQNVFKRCQMFSVGPYLFVVRTADSRG